MYIVNRLFGTNKYIMCIQGLKGNGILQKRKKPENDTTSIIKNLWIIFDVIVDMNTL